MEPPDEVEDDDFYVHQGQVGHTVIIVDDQEMKRIIEDLSRFEWADG
jgi:hypothetical protein